MKIFGKAFFFGAILAMSLIISGACWAGQAGQVHGLTSEYQQYLFQEYMQSQGLSDGQAQYKQDGAAGRGYQAQGFFDWLDNLFGWWGDANDALEEQNNYDDDGIPNTAFTYSRYGMNLHNLDTMSVDDFKRTLSYAGPWIRFSMHTDEVAESNWGYRLEPGLRKIRQAGNELGVTPRVVINLTGFSTSGSGGNYMDRNQSWDTLASRYGNLARSLTAKVNSLGFGDAIMEAWNEPDNTGGDIGIGIDPGDDSFDGNLIKLLNAFSSGVKASGGITAFSPFTTINDSKYDLQKSIWESVHEGFDYFSAHLYDDEPGKARYWAGQVAGFTGSRPVIITEHGYQSHLKDTDYYRRQAWALEQGFQSGGQTTLQGVMNYVYGSDHQPWVIGDNEDFFWAVTHDSKP